MSDPGSFSIIERLLSFDIFLPLVITGAIVTSVVVKAIAGMVATQARERTRREIAAYIAEGAMTPEQGERLMRAGPADRAGNCS